MSQRAMTFGSLFSGIGGFDLGLDRIGMRCLWQCEQDANCNQILSKNWPDVRRHEHVGTLGIATEPLRPQLICGGFPCQDLSVAGKRAGLAGKRSGLFFEFMRIVREFAPEWILIENVPGLLSSNQGRDMGVVLWALAELGYGFAYRILDAQWFGVAQRRARVFIVGNIGDWRSAAEVLFERESLPRDSAPSRKAGTPIAASLTSGANSNGNGGYAGRREDDVNLALARSLTTREGQRLGQNQDTLICGTLNSHAKEHGHAMTTQQAAECGQLIAHTSEDGTGRGVPFVMQERMESLNPNAGPHGKGWSDDGIAFTLEARPRPQTVGGPQRVRRLTPLECERLQGFPDGWTQHGASGKQLSDSARYRMIGNAVAVPVAEWIGRRILEAAEMTR